jgi:flavin prenyltransferase
MPSQFRCGLDGYSLPTTRSARLISLTCLSRSPYALELSLFRSQHLAQQQHPTRNSGVTSGRNLTIATTGASGSLFLQQLLRAVERDERIAVVNFIASDSGLRVLAEELGITGRNNLIEQLLGHASSKFHQQANADIGANVASGSYPADAMIVIPCSVGTLARIANGIASHLIERAADVSLKEKRPLVLCVRETPLNKIHIRNMYRAADAGATIFPLIPTFYNRPASAEVMAREFAYRVLAHIGLPQDDAYRWKS